MKKAAKTATMSAPATPTAVQQARATLTSTTAPLADASPTLASPTLPPPNTPSPSPTPAHTPSPTASPAPARPTGTPVPEIRRGFGIHVKGVNYADDSLDKAIALGFEWIKIYDHPPPERLPFRVLYRVNLPRPDEDWSEWGHYRFLDAQLYAGRIDAYEIGNEPNLIEEWGKPPDPAAYAELLAVAYREIKAADPNALIVSAGLAPVGSSTDPRYVNDLEYLRAMYEHGAANWFDILGVHPYGFAYRPEIAPDGRLCGSDTELVGPVPEPICQPINGLCFRRVEQLRQIMVEFGDQDKPVWATEFGWIIRPPACCAGQSDWAARHWQAVSESTQARYILRAFAYAERHWPWMEAMFLWNLDFSRYAPVTEEGCSPCETMGWYSILNPDGSPRLAYKWLER